MTEYERQAHRVQTALAFLITREHGDEPQPVRNLRDVIKHLRVGIDTSKSDIGGLATLLISKGVFTTEEYTAALTDAMRREADGYERMVQAVLSNRNVSTR